ncbi:hypothetical protein [Gemmatimonas sp.]|uniref:hypothetical protein n=1 Tax=Gemmatimonas sp. TaxID=1962908 RepID=UPI0039833FCE
MRAARRLTLGLASWLVGSGCVYYNGIYNAQAEARLADANLRRDDDGEATTRFQRSAAIAETVLVRHPNSKWRNRARYIAARSGAMAAQCERAMPRLQQLLAGTTLAAGERDRSRLALASCEVRSGRSADARPRLDSMFRSGDRELARQSRIWAARAALSMGDRDAVPAYLANLDAGVLQWELISASMSAREFTRVESLLVQRARVGDYREDVTRALRELLTDGRHDAAERIVAQYDAARVRDDSRARMHYTIGDMLARTGLDSIARRHLYAARTLSQRDTVTAHEANARLALLDLKRVASLRELDTLVARQDSAVWRTSYAREIADRVLLFRLLVGRGEPERASLYLAAEIARDSLRAPRLARTLFLRIARESPTSPLVPDAWYAAALLEPDSAAAWQRRVRLDFGNSAVAARLRGEDPTDRPDFLSTPDLLTLHWTGALRIWTDSVRKLRLPPKPAGSR